MGNGVVRRPAIERRAMRCLIPLAAMLVLWALSSIPVAADQTMAGVFIPTPLQKSMHVVAYASLAVAWFWALGFGRGANTWAFVLTVAYAAVDELHQTYVPGRYGSPRDVALDACGAILGLLAVWALRRRSRRNRGAERELDRW